MVKTIVTVAITVLCTMVIIVVGRVLTHRRRKKRKNAKKVLNTYMKVMVTVVEAHAMIMVTLSYILSFFDKQPVETVSAAIVTEIVAPLAIYGFTKTVENIFQKNKLAFSEPISNINSDIQTGETEE